MPANPVLLKLEKEIVPSTVLEVAETGQLFACDFAVTGAEHFEEKPWGYEQDRLVNIDHHAPTVKMRQHISSTNLALLYVEQNGAAKPDDTVVINHTDCDSILAAAIMCGHLEPLPKFGAAAIAADHSGEENAIADLLQALEEKRDYQYSLRKLRLVLDGDTLDTEVQTLLDKRLADRAAAKELVDKKVFNIQDNVAWLAMPNPIDSAFFPALLPGAAVIVTFSPRPSETGMWNVKARLGVAAHSGISIEKLIRPIDANFGGRWNAGSNKRGGGSTVLPKDYVEAIATNLGGQGK